MSKSTKRKHVFNNLVMNEFTMPTEGQSIVQVISSKGNNLHEVRSSLGDVYLVSMPSKFRKNVWIKKGDFLLVEPITEGDKVKAEIVNVITSEFIKYLKCNHLWPEQFSEKADKRECDVLFNSNRQVFTDSSTTDDSD